MRVSLLGLLLAASACASATGAQSDATPTDTKANDASIDGNGCATQPCSILPECGCGGANACDIDISDGKGTACRSINTPGHETAACTQVYQCDEGYVCLGQGASGSCKKYCTANADCGSPRGQCVIDLTDQNGTPIMGAPSACSSNCEPTSTNSPECPSTFKCNLFTTMHSGSTVRIAGCTPAGTGVQGDTCGAAPGNDALCAKGYSCSTTTSDATPKCRRICQKAASNCGAATCLSFSPPFTVGLPPPGVEYGICQ